MLAPFPGMGWCPRAPGQSQAHLSDFSITGVPMLSVQPKGKQKGCAGCNRKIKDRYLLKALDKYWHEDCLKCACCDCRLGEVGSTLYTKANLILCRRDYLRWVLLPCPTPTAPILLAWCNSAPSSKPGSLVHSCAAAPSSLPGVSPVSSTRAGLGLHLLGLGPTVST